VLFLLLFSYPQKKEYSISTQWLRNHAIVVVSVDFFVFPFFRYVASVELSHLLSLSAAKVDKQLTRTCTVKID